MNILVTGANGQLGMEMRAAASCSRHNFVFSDIVRPSDADTIILDITDEDAVNLVCESEKVDLIVNCAAYTNVDAAEDDVTMAGLLNSTAPGNLARVARRRGASLIHISTDYVFPGDSCIPLKESDVPAPVSVYGRTKLEGEREIERSQCNYIIIRTSWLYSPNGRNFVKTILKLMSDNRQVKVVYDQVGSPTSAADLAAAIMHIIDCGGLVRKGIYHFSNEGAVSWYDFARAVRDISGLRSQVIPCLSSEFPSKVSRPHYSVLDKTLIKSTFGVEVPYWRDSLEKCLRELDDKN